ncbi:MAG: carbamoyl-phosphate synthase small subunit [Gammaproteobacteria bacterium]|nr:carbamoyl-phosphate synthase small subunit [Gammaproteobacteria bacterium]
MTHSAILALADGSVFHGTSIGVSGETVGEVVFNTSMTGYQEMLTDPSYNQQILTLTYPHIGNTGCNPGDQESSHVYAAGLVIRDLPLTYSNWRATESLADYLQRHKIVAIADIDTRKLTRILREKGAQNACILAGDQLDEKLALEKARAFPGLSGMDLAQIVSTPKNYEWTTGTWCLKTNDFKHYNANELPYHVVAYDYGVKQNILRILADFGCRVTVVPAKTSAQEVLALKPDGVFLSNGPGDPASCDYAIKATQEFLRVGIPLFGICLGHQILGLAVGANTLKMKFGHHGANHPVKDLQTDKVLITTQNHGFAVDEKTLPNNVEVTHVSLFDGSLQGMRLKDKPAFSFQGHPEASAGPHDLKPLFERFIEMMQENKK